MGNLVLFASLDWHNVELSGPAGSGSIQRCVSGYGWYGSTRGEYTISITGAHPTLGIPTLDMYPVVGGKTFAFTFSIAGSTLQGTWDLTDQWWVDKDSRIHRHIKLRCIKKLNWDLRGLGGSRWWQVIPESAGGETVSQIFDTGGERTEAVVSSGSFPQSRSRPVSV